MIMTDFADTNMIYVPSRNGGVSHLSLIHIFSREALDGQIISWDSVKSWYKAKNWMVERIEDLEYDLKILKKLAPVAAVNYIRKAIGYDEYLKDYAQYRRCLLYTSRCV